MAISTVLTPLDHDGEHYEPGDSVDISSAKQAKALIDLGVITAPQKAVKTKTKAAADSNGDASGNDAGAGNENEPGSEGEGAPGAE